MRTVTRLRTAGALLLGLTLAACAAAGSGLDQPPAASAEEAPGGAADSPSPATSSEGPAGGKEPASLPADPEAFRGLGKLAFVREGRLYILDGETGALREVDGAAPASAPSWSADGRWLAFRQGEGDESRIVVAEAATGAIRELTGLPGPVEEYEWAATGSALAVAAGNAIWLVDDPARPQPRRLAAPDGPFGALTWSPDGRHIAYVVGLPDENVEARSDALEVVDTAEGKAVRWYVAEEAGIVPAGWWPDSRGILFWVLPQHSNSIAADGLPLQSLALGSHEPVALPDTLLYQSWVAWRPGSGELLLVQGSGRPVWDGKALALCNPGTGACRNLPQPEDTVSLDPAWSPDGQRIALVRAQRRPEEWGFTGDDQVMEWVESRRLWVMAADGSGAREMATAGGGIYNPTWSRDGRHLLYVQKGALRVLDLETGQTRWVADLGEPENDFGFYGHIGQWAQQMDWHQGP
ncbi:MAG: hypothetical protein L6E13_12380 [Firmicutes bacterium]|nr:hypothetical protein [Bacillota bacterium]